MPRAAGKGRPRANRRGTKVRFKPDPQIFGEKARFSPQRLFKMARAKAYLFGGVEIRWRCEAALLAGIEGVPAEETFHFPGGLKDYLAGEIEGKGWSHPEIFTGRSDGPAQRFGRMGGRLDRGRRRLRLLLLQHDSDRRRRHA